MGHHPRQDFTGAIHHIYTRGNDKQIVFKDDIDRLCFLSELNNTVEDTDWKLYTWCLMSNHFHLLIETPEPNLSKGMQKLLHSYSKRFNLRYQRTGHVFNARFGSKLVTDDSQFQSTVRYILRNPVEAGLVERPQDWRWSSYRETISGYSPKISMALSGLWSRFEFSNHKCKQEMADFFNSPNPQEIDRPSLNFIKTEFDEDTWMAQAFFEFNYSIPEIAEFAGLHRTTVWRRINATKVPDTIVAEVG